MISIYGKPFFIKIDVEGYEYNVIKTLNERIQFLNIEANLPEFLDETLRSIQHLMSIWNNYEFNISTDYKFDFDVWQNGSDFCEFIRGTDRRYLDIWVRANRDQDLCTLYPFLYVENG